MDDVKKNYCITSHKRATIVIHGRIPLFPDAVRQHEPSLPCGALRGAGRVTVNRSLWCSLFKGSWKRT